MSNQKIIAEFVNGGEATRYEIAECVHGYHPHEIAKLLQDADSESPSTWALSDAFLARKGTAEALEVLRIWLLREPNFEEEVL